MESDYNLYKKHRDNWFNSVELDPEEVKPHIDRHRKIDALLPHSSSFYGVINFKSYQYDFLGKGQELLTGYDNDFVCQQGIRFQMENIFPEDGELILKHLYPQFSQMTQEVSEESLQDYVMQCNYRFYNKEGRLIHLLEQVWILQRDSEGAPCIGLLYVSKLPEMNPFRMSMSIKKLQPDNSYQTLYERHHPHDRGQDALSEREIETVKLLAEGSSSRDIAEELCLSYHTVRTHRKNILRKLKLSSTGELVAWAFNNNLL